MPPEENSFAHIRAIDGDGGEKPFAGGGYNLYKIMPQYTLSNLTVNIAKITNLCICVRCETTVKNCPYCWVHLKTYRQSRVKDLCPHSKPRFLFDTFPRRETESILKTSMECELYHDGQWLPPLTFTFMMVILVTFIALSMSEGTIQPQAKKQLFPP